MDALYVFGSYARGAQISGDLDILLEVRAIEGLLPPSALVKRLALGRPTHVDVLIDSVGTDHFRAQFAEAHLVWSRTRPDWKSNLAALPELPDATRFARKTDSLPFPLRSLNVTREEAEEIVDRIERQEFVSKFVPLEAIQIESEHWNDDQSHLAKCASMGEGAATKKIVLPALQHMFAVTKEPYSLRYESRPGRFTSTTLYCGSAVQNLPSVFSITWMPQ